MGGHMLKRSTRKTKPAKHEHDFRTHNIGADLERQICRGCGHISINSLPPLDLRAELLDVNVGLFRNSDVTLEIADALKPVLSPFRCEERMVRR
jgi:hypothetical protein